MLSYLRVETNIQILFQFPLTCMTSPVNESSYLHQSYILGTINHASHGLERDSTHLSIETLKTVIRDGNSREADHGGTVGGADEDFNENSSYGVNQSLPAEEGMYLSCFRFFTKSWLLSFAKCSLYITPFNWLCLSDTCITWNFYWSFPCDFFCQYWVMKQVRGVFSWLDYTFTISSGSLQWLMSHLIQSILYSLLSGVFLSFAIFCAPSVTLFFFFCDDKPQFFVNCFHFLAMCTVTCSLHSFLGHGTALLFHLFLTVYFRHNGCCYNQLHCSHSWWWCHGPALCHVFLDFNQSTHVPNQNLSEWIHYYSFLLKACHLHTLPHWSACLLSSQAC